MAKNCLLENEKIVKTQFDLGMCTALAVDGVSLSVEQCRANVESCKNNVELAKESLKIVHIKTLCLYQGYRGGQEGVKQLERERGERDNKKERETGGGEKEQECHIDPNV